MIELILNGGLGNQMFEYAYARTIQLITGDKLAINIFTYDMDRFQRNFSLNHYHLADNLIVYNKKRRILKICRALCKEKEKVIYKVGKKIKKEILLERHKVFEVNGINRYIYGYFQGEKFFEKYANEIKQEFILKHDISEKNKKILYNIQNCNSVCVHVRRGDYVTSGFLVCDKEYYMRAIEKLKQENDNYVFYFFSDDISWTKENIYDESYIYVDNDNPDYEELELMRNCKHFIISNSSFSWWAQYLSENTDKKVIAPNRWDNSGKPMNDIYMKNWIIL